MGDLFYALGIFLVFFGLLYINYGSFTATVVKWKQRIKKSKKTGKIKVDELPIGTRLSCYIPFLQPAKVCKALYGAGAFAMSYTVFCCLDALLIVVPIIIKFFIPINAYVMFYATIAFYFGMVLHALTYGIITVMCARLYSFGWLYTIAVFFVPQVLCFYMKSNIGMKMHDMYEEQRFDENRGDTVIKRKSDK